MSEPSELERGKSYPQAPGRGPRGLSKGAKAALVAFVIIGALGSGLYAVIGATRGPSVRTTSITELTSANCLAFGPMSELRFYGLGDEGTLTIEGRTTAGEPTYLSLDLLSGNGSQSIFRGVNSVGEIIPLPDNDGFIFTEGPLPYLGDQFRLWVAPRSGRARQVEVPGPFDCMGSGHFFLLMSGESLAFYDKSSVDSFLAGPVTTLTRRDPESRPYPFGEYLQVPPGSDPSEDGWRVFAPALASKPGPIRLLGRTQSSWDGRWLAVCPPTDFGADVDTYWGKEILLYNIPEAIASWSDEPAARIVPLSAGVSELEMDETGSILAYLDGPAPYPYSDPGTPPATLFLARSPSFAPEAVEAPAGVTWRPGSFSADGRYLLVEVVEASSGTGTGYVVLDTLTGSASTIPAEAGTLEETWASWAGNSTVFIGPGLLLPSEEPSDIPWRLYDAATGGLTTCPWSVAGTSAFDVHPSPDGRYACVKATIPSPAASGQPGTRDLGPFKGLAKGEWLLIFPLETGS